MFKKFSVWRWFEDLPIFRKGLLILLVPILFQLVSVVLFWLLYDRIDKGRELAKHSRDIMADIDQLRVQSNAAYYNSVLSIVAKNWDAEQSASANLAEARSYAETIEALTRDNPIQNTRSKNILDQLKTFENTITKLDSAASGAGVKPEPLQQENEISPTTKTVLALFNTSLSNKKLLDEAVSEMRDEEIRLQTLRFREVDDMLMLAGWFVFGGFIIILSISTLFFVLFRESIEQRLQIMSDNLKKIELGEILSPKLTGQDEIARVDKAIHSLAGALAEKALDTEVFLYSVSHDLRSPLVNLSGFTDELRYSSADLKKELAALKKKGAEVGPALNIIDTDFEKSFGFIRSAISRLSKIIEALLRLSRAGRLRYKDEPVALGPVVERIVTSLGSSISNQKAEILVDPLPTVYGDDLAYEQIFANLLANALTYLEPSRKGLIKVSSIEDPDEKFTSVIAVTDNGIGLNEASKKKLFMAFQRFSPQAGPGEGIGLAITRRMVNALGGRIWCESTEGVGSTFYLALPKEPNLRLELPEAVVGF